MHETIDRTASHLTDYCRAYAKGRISAERLLSFTYHVLSEHALDDDGKIGFVLEALEEPELVALSDACADSLWHGKRGDSFKVANIRWTGSGIVDGLENTRVPYEFVRRLGRATRV